MGHGDGGGVVANPSPASPTPVQTIVDADACSLALLGSSATIVQILSAEDVEEDRREKVAAAALALTTWCRPHKPRERRSRLVEQTAPASACSKAERWRSTTTRSPGVRLSRYANLDNEGRRYGAPYADVDVACGTPRAPEMDTFLQQLASGAQVEGADRHRTHIDDGSEEIDDDLESGATSPPRPRRFPTRRRAEPSSAPRSPGASVNASPSRSSTRRRRAVRHPRRARRPGCAPTGREPPRGEVTGVRSLPERRPTDRMDAADSPVAALAHRRDPA